MEFWILWPFRDESSSKVHAPPGLLRNQETCPKETHRLISAGKDASYYKYLQLNLVKRFVIENLGIDLGGATLAYD